MLFYQAVIIGLFILNVPAQNDRKIYKHYALFLSFIVMVAIAGLKSTSVGSDTPVYVNLFYTSLNQQVNLSSLFTQRFEGGYIFLNQVLFKIYPNVQILFLAISIITIFCWLYVIDKLSSNLALSVFLFCTFRLFSLLLSNLRQSLAMALVVLAFYLLYKNHVGWSVCLTLLAGTFHISAFVFILYIILRKIKVSKSLIILATVTSLLGYAVFNRVLGLGLSLFPKYSSYFQNEALVNETKVLSIATFGILGLTFILGNIIINKTESTDDSYLSQLNVVMLFACVLSFIALRTSSFNRLTSYFSMFIILYIPKILSLIKKNSTRMILTAVIVSVFFLYNLIIMYFRPEWNYIIPYTTFWQTLN